MYEAVDVMQLEGFPKDAIVIDLDMLLNERNRLYKKRIAQDPESDNSFYLAQYEVI